MEENQGQQNQGQNQETGQQPEKTFTQAELDTIVARRLAKAQKGMPDEAELTAFRAWKDSQQTEQQRRDALTAERDKALADLAAAQAKAERYERERFLLSKGVPASDVDYYAFKAGQLVSDSKTFEQAAEEVIKTRIPQPPVRIDLGGGFQHGGQSANTTNATMNALIRGAGK